MEGGTWGAHGSKDAPTPRGAGLKRCGFCTPRNVWMLGIPGTPSSPKQQAIMLYSSPLLKQSSPKLWDTGFPGMCDLAAES